MIHSLLRPLLLSLSFVFVTTAIVAGATSAPTIEFRSGDRWSVIGDSITHHGSYYAWVYLYELTRFPQQELVVENCGISGDSAAGTVQRYDWDIAPTRPTVATIMLGMNDVDREAYSEAAPTPENQKRREAALSQYRQSLEALVDRLQHDYARVVFLTPSPFDEQLVGANQPNHPGVSAALAECARFMADLATRKGAALVDFQKPMLELNAQLQARDPRATVIGPDRVHPGIPGHFVMAYLFLRAQNAPATVARIAVDAAAGSAKSERADVSKIEVETDAVEFDCREAALPYPVPDEAKLALDWVPFVKELNQETLQVSAFKSGAYVLEIDGERVGSFSAEQLQQGINLAELPSTPQMTQAREVLSLMREWQELVTHSQRTLAEVEHWRLRGKPHPVQLEDVRPFLLEEYDRLSHSAEPNRKWDCINIQRYFVLKPQQAPLQQELAALQARMHAAAQPQRHHFSLQREERAR
ncbi:MAG TPA: SGNH/GDSL hydrolase family protein [Opitutaceae bacterium]|nr:SGNH/GDSL hydrolase family protein [Opitutaceae bacterium]